MTDAISRAGNATFRLFRQRRFAALIEQLLLSGSNFIGFLLFAREVSPTAWGSFGFAFAAVLFMQGFQRAAVTIPMIAFSPLPEDWAAHRTQWVGANLGMTGLCCACLAAGLAAAIGARVAWVETSCWMALAMCGPAFLLEFARRSAIQEGRFGLLMAMAAGYALCLLTVSAGAASRVLAGWAPAVAVVAGSGLAVLIFAAVRGPSSLLAPVRWPKVDGFARFAGWSALGHLGYSGYNFGIQAILGATAGPAAVGAFHSCRVLVQPVNTLIGATDSVDKPRAAAAYASVGRVGLLAVLQRSMLLLSLFAVPYVAAAAIWRHDLLALAYGPTYGDQGPALLMWCVVALATACAQPIESGLYVIRRTKALFVSRAVASIASVATAIPLAIAFGTPGALAAMALGYTVAAGLGAWVIRREA